jgi:hypothetical protein
LNEVRRQVSAHDTHKLPQSAHSVKAAKTYFRMDAPRNSEVQEFRCASLK